MNINKNNYEEFFIDYYDGNLSAEQVAELFLFLESNPELKSEFDGFSNITLDKTDLSFPFKDELKKELINDSNFSQFMIASVEGDLSPDEKSMLDLYLKNNPNKVNDLKLFQAAILTPGNESFPGKKELKQPVPMQFNFSNYGKYAIAAVLFLIFMSGVYLIFFKSSQKSAVEFAEVTTPVSQDSSSAELNDSTVEKATTLPENKPNEKHDRNSIDHDQKFANNTMNVDATEKRSSNRKAQTHSIHQNNVSNNRIEIALMESLPVKQLPVSENEPLIAQVPSMVSQDEVASVSSEKYLSLWEAVRQTTDKKLQKFTSNDNEVLALADENSTPAVSVKELLEKGIEKVSNDKVSIKNDNDLGADFSRFSFSLGNFKFEKDRVK